MTKIALANMMHQPLDQPSGTLLSCELRRSPWYLILLAIAPGKSPQNSHQSVSWRLSRLDLKSFVFFLLPRLERTNYPSTLYKNFAFSFYCALSINRYIISFFCQYSPSLSFVLFIKAQENWTSPLLEETFLSGPYWWIFPFYTMSSVGISIRINYHLPHRSYRSNSSTSISFH